MGLFGSSGIRRLADRSLLEIALRAGLALGRVRKRVVVARDTRTSGEATQHALVAGLLSSGARCYNAGTVPTPTLALAAREFDAGVMVTASHNPPEYNGLKLINPDGSGFDLSQQAELEKLILNDPLPTARWTDMTERLQVYEGAVDRHIEHILKQLGHEAETGRSRFGGREGDSDRLVPPRASPGQPPTPSNIRVVVDCSSGAASVITPYLLRRMGCDVVALNCQPSGFFPHDAEPNENNLGDLIKATSALGAVGIAHDGDADRMMAVDDKGRFIPGDKLLVLLARQTGAEKVVTTVDASMAIEEAGFTVSRTKVGDTYVSEHLRQEGDFGGEPSGAWIFPKNSYCPDGIFAAAALISVAGKETLSSLVDAIPQYPVYRGSVAGSDVRASDLKAALMGMRPRSADESDGIKLIFDDGWLLVRPSGTEPKIRITAEATSESRAHELYDRAAEMIRGMQR